MLFLFHIIFITGELIIKYRYNSRSSVCYTTHIIPRNNEELQKKIEEVLKSILITK